MFDRISTYNIFRCARNVYQQSGGNTTLLFPGASADYIYSALLLLQHEHDLKREQMVKIPFSGRGYQPPVDHESDTYIFKRDAGLGGGDALDVYARNTPAYAQLLKRRGITMKKLLARQYLDIVDYMALGQGTATLLGVLYDMAKAEGCAPEFLAKTRVLAFSQEANCSAIRIIGTPGSPEDTITIPVDRTEARYAFPSASKLTRRRDRSALYGFADATENVFRQTPQFDMGRPNPRLRRTNMGFMPLLAEIELRRFLAAGEPMPGNKPTKKKRKSPKAGRTPR